MTEDMLPSFKPYVLMSHNWNTGQASLGYVSPDQFDLDINDKEIVSIVCVEKVIPFIDLADSTKLKIRITEKIFKLISHTCMAAVKGQGVMNILPQSVEKVLRKIVNYLRKCIRDPMLKFHFILELRSLMLQVWKHGWIYRTQILKNLS